MRDKEKFNCRLDMVVSMLRLCREDLDISGTPCPTCHRPHYNNWPEFQADDKLKAAVTKVLNAKELVGQPERK